MEQPGPPKPRPSKFLTQPKFLYFPEKTNPAKISHTFLKKPSSQIRLKKTNN